MGFPGGSDSKESTCSVGDLGSTPGLGRSPGGGHGNPLQYSCLKNPHGQRSLAGVVHGISESNTMTEWLSMHTHTQWVDIFGLLRFLLYHKVCLSFEVLVYRLWFSLSLFNIKFFGAIQDFSKNRREKSRRPFVWSKRSTAWKT